MAEAKDNGRKQKPQGAGERGRRRATRVIILSCVLLLLLLSLIAQGGFNLSPFLSPETAGETLLLYALSTLNFLAFVTLLFVLLRNVIKLERERRAGVAGSRFKTRLVFYTVALSLLPVVLMFVFAYGLLNRSIDRWFGDPARQIVEDAKAIQQGYYQREEESLLHDARSIARNLSAGALVETELDREMQAYNLSLVRVISLDQRLTIQDQDQSVQVKIAKKLDKVERRLLRKALATTARGEVKSPDSIYFIAGLRLPSPSASPRLLLIARQFPPELTARSLDISEHHQNFYLLKDKVRRIKATYILLLAAVALLLVFSASWLALHVARGVTVPIQALAEATTRVARGDFERPVETLAEDELATLVSSFNQMARMIAENRKQLEKSAEDLQLTNTALDDRRRYIETVLESLSTGVISIDAKSDIATINQAALAILGLSERPAIGTPMRALTAQVEELLKLCRRAWRSDIAQAEIAFLRADGSTLYTATTAIALRQSKGGIEGWVIVIEDLTHLIQAERAAAWSEVARRMAHEIKNPLTPIQLSAERILRNYQRHYQGDEQGKAHGNALPDYPRHESRNGKDADGVPAASRPLSQADDRRDSRADSRFDEIVRDGTATIVREVSALQRMVEEFSRFARLPEARPVEVQLNDVVNEAIGLYAERLHDICLEAELADDLPLMRLDPEQFKRVLVNLIDNALEAIHADTAAQNGALAAGGAAKLIRIETRYYRETETVLLIVSDTGHGIKPADRNKLFLPKFSTRDRGTGLGLAIVSQIISEQKGRIRVEDNQPRGARFVIELPL